MRKSILSLIVLSVVAAVPAAAISPGVVIPKRAAVNVKAETSAVSTVSQKRYQPVSISAHDCRASLRSYFSRNTLQPSVRRRAMAACDETVASAQSAD